MKDEFYIVLPSNSSMRYHAENTTTHFITHLPQQIRLQGEWSVAMTEVQIPLTFQHVTLEKEERLVSVTRLPHTRTETNNIRLPKLIAESSLVTPGVYENIETLIHEINNLNCLKDHIAFIIEIGGYVTAKKICTSPECSQYVHEVYLSKKLRKILGFDHIRDITIDDQSITSDRPSNLSNGLPSMFMIYTDICEPLITGDVQSRLLRALPFGVNDYKYGNITVKNFSPPMYLPLLFHSFQTIEIDIRDQQGQPIPFDYGTLTVTLHFKRIE